MSVVANEQDVANWVLSWKVDPVPSKTEPDALDFDVTVGRPDWAEVVEDEPDEVTVTLNAGFPEYLWDMEDYQDVIRNQIRMKVYTEMHSMRSEDN